MMDLSEKGSGSEEMKKTCVDCSTTKTPLWRGGPAGPKTLCNACGIKHRKRRRALMLMNKGTSQPQDKTKTKKEVTSSGSQEITATTTSSSHNKSRENSKMDVALKLRLLTLGRQVLLRRSAMEKQRKFKLGEEEQAAILLMALSCGSIY